MADIPFYQGSETGSDYSGSDYFGDADHSDYLLEDQDAIQDQDNALPINKINAYLQSDNIYTRQVIARNLMDSLQRAENADERLIVLGAVKRLACDLEPSVKAECFEQLPNLTIYCHENQGLPGLQDVVSSYLLPAAICSLHDNSNQVRKSAQTALLSMLERRLITEADIEDLVCPSILELIVPDITSEDLRTEAVSLLTRASTLISNPNIVERILLPKFCELCTDNLFHIRKVCASSFGELCAVVTIELTEEQLLPKFLSLCEDGVWGVRKACAECFTQVSNCCSVRARMDDLARVFSALLNDQSRWVRMAAFQALGPFISTFAGQDVLLYIDEDGVLRVREPAPEPPPQLPAAADTSLLGPPPNTQQQESDDKSLSTSNGTELLVSAGPAVSTNDIAHQNGDTLNMLHVSTASDEEPGPDATPATEEDKSLEELMWQMFHMPKEERKEDVDIEEPENAQYGSVSFWREPLPAVTVQLLVGDSEKNCSALNSQCRTNTEVRSGPNCSAVTSNGVTTVEASSSAHCLSSVDDELAELADELERGGQKQHFPSAKHKQPAMVDRQEYDSLYFNEDKTATTDTDATTKFLFNPPNSVSSDFQMSSFNSFSITNFGYQRRSSSGSSAGEPTLAENYAHDQSVIPPVLLENYLSMAEPSRAQSVDSDIARHCAYSFPAVAYTLGKENWRCLKELYDILASDMQWKVRRTLAFSIHDLAVILGPEATRRDLVPVFDGFLKDLDEVKVGVLRHLADFLKLMDTNSRKMYLPRLKSFLVTDNNRNWRFRLDLAEQATQLVDLYDPEDVYEHLVPLGLTLLSDRVHEVRHSTFSFVSKVLERLQPDEYKRLRLMLVDDLIAKFARSSRWLCRQMFVQMCEVLLKDGAVLPDQLAKEFLPSLLTLAVDRVPNVRLALSKSFFMTLLPVGYFSSLDNPHYSELMETCAALKTDTDRDVRFYAADPQPFAVASDETAVAQPVLDGTIPHPEVS